MFSSSRAITVTMATAIVGAGFALGVVLPRETSMPKLGATVREFSLTLDHNQVAAGRMKLTVHNNGAAEHEVVAFRTNLGDTDLPMNGDRINEDGAGITHIDPEAEDVASGSSKTITLNLSPGRYVFVCNLKGHYQQGMHSVLTVR
jgi:uncharacterized cupredoxin-like copper-binding protein